MILRNITQIPLTETSGIYSGWLGDIRLVVPDDGSITHGSITVRSRSTLEFIDYQAYLTLPAPGRIEMDPVNPGSAVFIPDILSITLHVMQDQVVSNVTGDIVKIFADSSAGTLAYLAYPFISANPSNSTIKDRLQGVILTTTFLDVPTPFAHSVQNTLTGDDIILTSTDVVGYDIADDKLAIASVNGQTGVVKLSTDNISEGLNNLYYTETRVSENVNVAEGIQHRNAFNPHGISVDMLGAETPSGAQTKVDAAFEQSKLHLSDYIGWYSSEVGVNPFVNTANPDRLTDHNSYWCKPFVWHAELPLDTIIVDVSTLVTGVSIVALPDNVFKISLNGVATVGGSIAIPIDVTIRTELVSVTKEIIITVFAPNVQALAAGLQRNEKFYGCAVDPTTGDIITVGYTTSEGVGRGDCLIVRMSSNLSVISRKTYGGRRNDYLQDVAVGPDGYIYACGYTSSDGEGNYDALIMKLDKDLMLVAKLLVGGGSDDYLYGITLVDDKVYACGFTSSTGAGSKDAFVIQCIDTLSDGSVIQKSLGSASDDRFYGITNTPTGTVVCVGRSGDTRSGLLVEFDSSLAILHHVVHGTTSSDQFNSVGCDSAGNSYVVGTCEELSERGYIVKLDPTFTVVNSCVIDTADESHLYSVAIASDTNIVISGVSGETGLLLQFTDGLVLNSSHTFGGSEPDSFHSSVCDTMGNIVVAGKTYSDGQSNCDGMLLRWYTGTPLPTGSFSSSILPGLILTEVALYTAAVVDAAITITEILSDCNLVVDTPRLTIQDSNITIVSGIVI